MASPVLPEPNGTRHYSSVVQMQLWVDGIPIPIAQMGLDFVILREPAALPPCEATVVFRIDQKEERWLVRLPNGVAGSKMVVMAPC